MLLFYNYYESARTRERISRRYQQEGTTVAPTLFFRCPFSGFPTKTSRPCRVLNTHGSSSKSPYTQSRAPFKTTRSETISTGSFCISPSASGTRNVSGTWLAFGRIRTTVDCILLPALCSAWKQKQQQNVTVNQRGRFICTPHLPNPTFTPPQRAQDSFGPANIHCIRGLCTGSLPAHNFFR